MAIADISKAYSVVYKALDYRSIRQDMIASNIANVDTPFYRPKDVNFEQYLARENKRIFGTGSEATSLILLKLPRVILIANAMSKIVQLCFGVMDISQKMTAIAWI